MSEEKVNSQELESLESEAFQEVGEEDLEGVAGGAAAATWGTTECEIGQTQSDDRVRID